MVNEIYRTNQYEVNYLKLFEYMEIIVGVYTCLGPKET